MTTLTTKQLARLALSKQGDLSFLLRKHQKPIYNQIWKVLKNEIKANSYLINSSRQLGKSFVLIIIAIEYCIQFPKSQIRFAIPVAGNYKDMYGKSIATISEQLDRSLGFEHLLSEKRITFENGSMIKFAGTDNNNAESLRGSASNLNIIDEAGFVSDLSYLYKSILLPQLTTTKGKTIFSSTPPPDLDNYYVDVYNQHLEEGLVSEYTIYDNTSIDDETLAMLIKEAGGIESSTFKREFLCQFVQETEMTIIPEWKEDYTQDWQRDNNYFKFYNKFTALDSGVADLTICLFGYYDFQHAKIIVEDEIKMNGPEMTTKWLSNDIKDKEEILGYDKVLLRIADNNNLHLIQDLAITYKLPFSGTSKTDLDAMINKVKIWIGQGKIIVKPNCEQLLGCLKFGKWEKKKRGELFAKSKKFGHYDALAALVYLVRNIESIMSNPIPNNFGFTSNTMVSDNYKKTNRASSDVKKLNTAFYSGRR